MTATSSLIADTIALELRIAKADLARTREHLDVTRVELDRAWAELDLAGERLNAAVVWIERLSGYQPTLSVAMKHIHEQHVESSSLRRQLSALREELQRYTLSRMS